MVPRNLLQTLSFNSSGRSSLLVSIEDGANWNEILLDLGQTPMEDDYFRGDSGHSVLAENAPASS